jgi:hypothetical protein
MIFTSFWIFEFYLTQIKSGLATWQYLTGRYWYGWINDVGR